MRLTLAIANYGLTKQEQMGKSFNIKYFINTHIYTKNDNIG